MTLGWWPTLCGLGRTIAHLDFLGWTMALHVVDRVPIVSRAYDIEKKTLIPASII
jgi:hypothetical protein